MTPQVASLGVEISRVQALHRSLSAGRTEQAGLLDRFEVAPVRQEFQLDLAARTGNPWRRR